MSIKEKMKGIEWEIKHMKEVQKYFIQQASKAVTPKDIEEMNAVVEDTKIQMKILYREREELTLESLR